ncbi:MAG: hypothetical protein F3745_03385 [Nitrospinae bacterium]|nr:hypothetical protein [Nitrospinota bacterium]
MRENPCNADGEAFQNSAETHSHETAQVPHHATEDTFITLAPLPPAVPVCRMWTAGPRRVGWTFAPADRCRSLKN